jgi:PAS domain S-box-containing protein
MDPLADAVLLQSVFQVSPFGIVVLNPRRQMVRINAALCRMTGYGAEDFLGRSPRFLYETDAEFERIGRLAYPPTIQGNPAPGSLETRWVHRDGHRIDLLLSFSLLDPGSPDAGLTFAVVDITERRRLERERRETLERAYENLRQSETRYRDLVENTSDVVFTVDSQARILYVSLPSRRSRGWIRRA